MDEIKKIINNCYKKLNGSKLKIDKEIIFYNIYLVSNGIINGCFIPFYKYDIPTELHLNNNNDIIDYITNVFKELKLINNIDFYIGKLRDSSYYNDTLYVYYKPKKEELFKYIKIIENKKNKINIYKNLAKILSYEILDNSKKNNNIIVKFIINNKSFYAYYTTKYKLYKSYDKLLEIKKYFSECYLQISND